MSYGKGGGATVKVKVMKEVESLDGLYAYMERTLGRFDKTPVVKPPVVDPVKDPTPQLSSLYVKVPAGGHIWGTAQQYQSVIFPPADHDLIAGESPDGVKDLGRDRLLQYNPEKVANPDYVDVGELLRIGPPLR